MSESRSDAGDGEDEAETSRAVGTVSSDDFDNGGSSRHSRSSSYGRQLQHMHFSFNFGSSTTRPSQKSLQEYFSSGRSHHGTCASFGITFSAQSQLPRLPIPTLEETMEKFPKVLEALQDARQQEETERIVREFLEADGPVLQEALLEYERVGIETGHWGSYVEEFWNESYLAPDASVVLNLNPYFVLEDAPDPKIAKDQLKRAAGLCFASVNIASLLQHETLSPDVFKGKPLCMDQFKALFGSSRQPSDGVSDEVHVYSDSSHGTKSTNNLAGVAACSSSIQPHTFGKSSS
jgi:Choline/Carnitine o-acyltransferase